VVPAFRLPVPGFVARMERSEIRGGIAAGLSLPDYASLHPGYEINEGSGTPTNAGSPTAASCDAARALLERARLSAFHRGSHLREYLIPKARLQARLPGTWSERALPAFACPSPGMHLPPRSSCRGADTQAAREQPAKPPAGTALAPMPRCAAAPRPSHERGWSCNWNGDGCQGVVAEKVTASPGCPA
jgi:hypothetical protein